MAKLISADELYKRRGVFADDIGKHGWREAINNLPAAEPERKRGKWIRHEEIKNIYGGKYIECSECSEAYLVQRIADEKFCRNCGADMRGDSDG